MDFVDNDKQDFDNNLLLIPCLHEVFEERKTVPAKGFISPMDIQSETFVKGEEDIQVTAINEKRKYTELDGTCTYISIDDVDDDDSNKDEEVCEGTNKNDKEHDVNNDDIDKDFNPLKKMKRNLGDENSTELNRNIEHNHEGEGGEIMEYDSDSEQDDEEFNSIKEGYLTTYIGSILGFNNKELKKGIREEKKEEKKYGKCFFSKKVTTSSWYTPVPINPNIPTRLPSIEERQDTQLKSPAEPPLNCITYRTGARFNNQNNGYPNYIENDFY